MKRNYIILALVLMVGLLALAACGGSASPGQASHSSAGAASGLQAPALSSSSDLDQQLNEIEQSLNDLETSLNTMPALPEVK